MTDPELIRPLLAGGAAGTLWLGDQILATVNPPPNGWFNLIDKYGLPLVMLALAIYAVVGLYKALMAEKSARLQDSKDNLAAYKKDMASAAISRREMIKELRDQTETLKKKEP